MNARALLEARHLAMLVARDTTRLVDGPLAISATGELSALHTDAERQAGLSAAEQVADLVRWLRRRP